MSSKQIGTLGTIPSITVGNRVFTDLDNLIILIAQVTASGQFTSFRKFNGTAGYQVTAGKTLTVEAFKVTGGSGTAGNDAGILYGDNDVGYNSVPAPTTPVYPGGLSTSPSIARDTMTATATFLPEGAINFQVPATKYLTLVANAAPCIMYVYGYEA